MNKLRAFLLALLVISIAFASCRSTEVDALAIFKGKALVTPLRIDAKEGNGLLINLTTTYGESTEESIMNAFKLIRNMTNKSCLFTIGFPELREGINGPSAGLLLALTFYSIVEDKPLTITATGAIGSNGEVYPVGGIYEKVKAALRNHERVLIPKSAPYIDLTMLSLWGDRVCITQNISQALSYAFNGCHQNATEVIKGYLAKEPKNPSMYNSSLFKKQAEKLMERERALIDKLPLYYGMYVREEIKVQRKMVEKGYYYTAANDAFHLYSYERAFVSNEKELMGELKRCLDSITFEEERETNAELITGAKARYYRAKEAYEEAKEKDWENMLFFQRIANKAELVQGIVWCEAAKDMNVKGKGRKVNIEALKFFLPKNETLGREGREMLANHDYLAYLFEYAFKKPGKRERRNYTTLWANVYASQAQYMSENHNDSDLYRAANNMEELFTSLSYESGEKETHINEKYIYAILSFIGGALICLLARLLRK